MCAAWRQKVATSKIKHLRKCFKADDFLWLSRGRKMFKTLSQICASRLVWSQKADPFYICYNLVKCYPVLLILAYVKKNKNMYKRVLVAADRKGFIVHVITCPKTSAILFKMFANVLERRTFGNFWTCLHVKWNTKHLCKCFAFYV